MANQIEVLKQTELLGQQFKVYGSPQEPLFLAKDVAHIINHSDVSMMLNSIDDEEKLIQTMLVSGQNRQVWMLTEEGLYEVLMQSRKPVAKEFKKGVKAILKEIRRTGGYIESRMNERFSRFFLQNCRILHTFALLTSWSLSTRRAFGQFAHIRASHCPTENNGGCRIRKKHAKLLRSGNVHLVSSVYGDRFLFAQLSIF